MPYYCLLVRIISCSAYECRALHSKHSMNVGPLHSNYSVNVGSLHHKHSVNLNVGPLHRKYLGVQECWQPERRSGVQGHV